MTIFSPCATCPLLSVLERRAGMCFCLAAATTTIFSRAAQDNEDDDEDDADGDGNNDEGSPVCFALLPHIP